MLFINGRLVDCSPLKRALEAVYAAALPKAERPFIFADVRLPLAHVDVNVHPTKSEVQILFLEEVIQAVQKALEGVLVRPPLRARRCWGETDHGRMRERRLRKFVLTGSSTAAVQR